MAYGFTINNSSGTESYSSAYTTFKVIDSIDIVPGTPKTVIVPAAVGRDAILLHVPSDAISEYCSIVNGTVTINVPIVFKALADKGATTGDSMRVIVGCYDG